VWAVAASRAALAELRPLIRAHERRRDVRVHRLPEDGLPAAERLRELVAGTDGLLLVGPRRRSPRTALPGPFVPEAGGRLVPVGWLPAVAGSLAKFAQAAARVARRSSGRPGPLAVLGQWDPRYLHLAARMELRLSGRTGGLRPLRWTAERVTRDDVVRGLRYGVGAAIYFGHGRPTGWAGYHGMRAHHLTEAAGEPVGAVLSVTCLNASRWNTGLAFSEALVLGGAASGAVGAVATVEHLENMRWMLGLARALVNGETLLGPALLRAAPGQSRSAGAYRILGDPLAQLVGASTADRRARAIFAPPPDACGWT
jgi:hypothetical protein